MVRVALLDDHPAVLAGLRRLIEPEPDLAVVGATGDPGQLAPLLDRSRPDVLVLDHDLARADGLSHCLRVKRRARPPAVVVYAAYTSPALALAARAAGADGLVDKAHPVRLLLDAIRTAAEGGRVIPGVPQHAYAAAVERIDDADLPVLAMLLDGTTVEGIAAALRRDPGEVAWRAQRIVGRLCPGLRQRPVDEPRSAAPAPSRRG
jgi:two-component system, NarL family, response regulator DevR